MNILISQRVDIVAAYGERRDALDQAWYAALSGLFGDTCVCPLPNDSAQAAKLLARGRFDFIVLTGGNDLSFLPGAADAAPERDSVEQAVLEHAANAGIPLLGVCRGFQHMNVFLGGRLRRCDGHVAVDHSLIPASGGTPLCVNSFHDFGIRSEDLSADLIPIYTTADGWVEAAAHRTRRWLGIMWHPERPNVDAVGQRAFIRNYFQS